MAAKQVTSFIDESGTGGDARIMLGGLAAKSHRWFGFAAKWRKLLAEAEIPFSHLVDMENGKPPFEGWSRVRTGLFVAKAAPIVMDQCDWGLTIALDHALHQAEYRARLSDKVHKDSAYGLCARAMIEGMTMLAIQTCGSAVRVNFVFEENEHFGDAKRIFDDCKAHLDPIGPYLGTITPGRKREYGGLQAADLVASIGRRQEATAVFSEAELSEVVRRRFLKSCPIWHVGLREDHMPIYCKQAEEIATEKRGAIRSRRFQKWKARKYPNS